MRHHIRVATDARRRHQTVHIPGVSDSVDLIGASGDKLVIVGQMGCSGGKPLLIYDPAANTSTVLLGPPISHGGGVERVILYPKS
jgi:hypothetical protein